MSTDSNPTEVTDVSLSRKRFRWGCVVAPTVAIGGLLALLAPAVQQARDAARMSQLT